MQSRRYFAPLLSFAAGFLVAAVGASLWFQEPRLPSVSPLVEIDLTTGNRSGLEYRFVLDRSSLVLNLLRIAADYQDMMYRVQDDQGHILWTGAIPPDEGPQAVTLFRSQFPRPGVYHLEFYESRQPSVVLGYVVLEVPHSINN